MQLSMFDVNKSTWWIGDNNTVSTRQQCGLWHQWTMNYTHLLIAVNVEWEEAIIYERVRKTDGDYSISWRYGDIFQYFMAIYFMAIYFMAIYFMAIYMAIFHGDIFHGDIFHGDIFLGDISWRYISFHGDIIHGDIFHGDIPWRIGDIIHGDIFHGDIIHGDIFNADILSFPSSRLWSRSWKTLNIFHA